MIRYRCYLKEFLNIEYKKNPLSLIYTIFVLFAFFGSIFMSYYSIKIDYIFSSDFLILPISVSLMVPYVILSYPIERVLIKCDEIIVDLNYAILFTKD